MKALISVFFFFLIDSSFLKMEKILTSLVCDVQKYVKNETKRKDYLNGLAKCNVRLFWHMESDVRLLRKVVKVSIELIINFEAMRDRIDYKF